MLPVAKARDIPFSCGTTSVGTSSTLAVSSVPYNEGSFEYNEVGSLDIGGDCILGGEEAPLFAIFPLAFLSSCGRQGLKG